MNDERETEMKNSSNEERWRMELVVSYASAAKQKLEDAAKDFNKALAEIRSGSQSKGD